MLDKAKRRAAGHFMLMTFSFLSNISYQLGHSVAGTGYERFGDGLSENEREYVKKMSTRLHTDAEVCRRLGWRFLGKKNL